MTRRLAVLALLAAALVTAPSAAGAQQAPVQEVGLGIRVVDAADAPIAGARVVVGSGAEDVSGENGWVRLPGVQPGRASVLVTRMGYRSAEFSVEVPLSGGMEVDVELEPAPVAVQGVTAVAAPEIGSLRAAGFYRRREAGAGTFLTREDIRKMRVYRTSDVFRQLRGVRVVSGGHGGGRLQTVRYGLSLSQRGEATGSSTATSVVCDMLTYLDGVLVHLGGIDDVLVHSLEAVEVYRGAGEVPAEFRVTNAACGVVALWTRVRG